MINYIQGCGNTFSVYFGTCWEIILNSALQRLPQVRKASLCEFQHGSMLQGVYPFALCGKEPQPDIANRGIRSVYEILLSSDGLEKALDLLVPTQSDMRDG
jgi:hypothetical protein